MTKAQQIEFPELRTFHVRLTEFERKIELEDFDEGELSFEAEYDLLREELEDLLHGCSVEVESDVIDGFVKRLNLIRDENGLYNEAEELDRMFPNRTDKGNDDGELESGFSTDKYF